MEKNDNLNVMVVVSIVCVGLMYNANTLFTVLMNSIVGDFFSRGIQITPTQIGMIISLPTLIMIFSVAISGKLSQYFSMRTIIIVSWILFGITGVMLYFAHDINYFLFIRAVTGFAVGLCQPMGRALAGKLFEGHRRAKVLGYISMGGGIISMAMSLVFGSITRATSWRICLWAFPIISILFIILAFAFIPKLPAEKAAGNSEGKRPELPPLGRPVWMLCVAGFCIYAIGAVIQIKSSVYMVQKDFGGVFETGILSATNTAGVVFGGLFFGNIYKALKRWILPIAAVLTGFCYYLFTSAPNFVVMCIAGFLICGISIGVLMAFLITRATFVAPPPRITMAITMVTLANYLGQFITTYYINLVETIFNAPIIPVANSAPQRLASYSLNAVAVCYLIIGAAGAVYIGATRKESAKAEMERATNAVSGSPK
jgi:MFS family permease